MKILCVEWGCGGRVWRWGREGNYRWNVSYYKVLNNFTCWVLFCGEQQLMILPLVSRVTGSEYSPATALLQARTLKFMYFESNFKPEKNERKPWDMKSKGLYSKSMSTNLQTDFFPSLELSFYSERVQIYVNRVIMPEIKGIMIYLLFSSKWIMQFITGLLKFSNKKIFSSLIISKVSFMDRCYGLKQHTQFLESS